MKKREAGQAFILVLIILAIGSLLVVPALRLTGTSLQSSQIVTREVEALYLADGAQEYVLWKFIYDSLGASFTDDGDNLTLPCEVCGTPVDIYIVMRAQEAQQGLTLATDDVIRPTKTVSPSTIPNDTPMTYTYTIKLEQLSDNNSQGLDVIYDILPKGFEDFEYVTGSSRVRVKGGEWETIADPLVEEEGGQVRMRWPASGNFTSPIRDFAVRQVKELEFRMDNNELPKNQVHCNWVVLKPWNTLSGPQAPINVGSPEEPGRCDTDGLLTVIKYVEPVVIQPGVETDVQYTVHITNLDGETHHIEQITDYLPPGFTYTDNSTSGNVTDINPQLSLENLNGVDRWELLWTEDEFPGGNAVSIASGETLILTFWAVTTKDVSGTYYNEIIVLPDKPVPSIFENIGITREEFCTAFSWNSGGVIVPSYDSEADAGEVLIDANIGLISGGMIITSWQIY